jgi:hypothetical protein
MKKHADVLRSKKHTRYTTAATLALPLIEKPITGRWAAAAHMTVSVMQRMPYDNPATHPPTTRTTTDDTSPAEQPSGSTPNGSNTTDHTGKDTPDEAT